MGCSLVEPDNLKPIFDRPGRDWTSEERRLVLSWLMEGRQLARLLLFAAHHLGYGTTKEDTEDAWQSYIIHFSNRDRRWIYPWGRDVDLYDPRQGLRFFDFMCYSFKRFCWRIGEQIRKRTDSEKPTEAGEDEAGRPIELPIPDTHPSVDPVKEALRRDLRRAIEDCADRLRSLHHDVFVRFYFEDKPVAMVAAELKIKEGYVKNILFLVRLSMRDCLSAKGWKP